MVIIFFAVPASVVILGGTEFGRGTVRAYRRTREIIEKKGRLTQAMQMVYARQLYCIRAGVRTAVTDYGVANDLIPALADRWKPY